MNARQSVLIAMFLTVAVFLLANASASAISGRIGSIKQVPAGGTTTPTPGFGGGQAGTSGGAGGAF